MRKMKKKKNIIFLDWIIIELMVTANAWEVVQSQSQSQVAVAVTVGNGVDLQEDSPTDGPVRSPASSEGSTRNEGKHSSISIAPSAEGSSFEGLRKRWRKMFPFHHPSSLSEQPHHRRGRIIPSSSPAALHTPASSPSVAPIQSQTLASPPAMLMFPPPPPNEDCAMKVTCAEPFTYTPPGVPCGCVSPIRIKLQLAVDLYTFFPLVPELAQEIAVGVSIDRGQVRIIGADSYNQWIAKTVIMIDLVPNGVQFDKSTALSVYERFWHKEIRLNSSMFGSYEVLSVRYAGLPDSPRLTGSSSVTSADESSSYGYGNGAQAMKPLGVDVPKRKNNGHGRTKTVIAIILLSSLSALVICSVIALLLFLTVQWRKDFPSLLHRERPVDAARFTIRRNPCYTVRSGGAAYAGSDRMFSVFDIERFTDKFEPSRILGEGGFGIVYRGVLDDGQEVAVKVLKRDDRHGSREFLSEVEMLGRLHHRNLVRLIGTCIEYRIRCLVYELIPNGSVESHLHGCHRETDPLDWGARMRIALGAARGLAYLHEDSNPRVIHRDFKSSNILLEYDFIPKVSDFGLARAAIHNDGYRQVSSRVMGTFGYLAPEYAMTGHLLVKSDVYSYGVVLLELLTGRKPVDLTLPPGQENLVAWARPFLMEKASLETIIDRSVKSEAPIDCLAKVAAIASMCVQPETSHRPFMGEVMQALQLVCRKVDETKETLTTPMIDPVSHEVAEASLIGEITPVREHDPCQDISVRISTISDQYEESVLTDDSESRTSTRHCRSGPLLIGKKRRFWQHLQSLSGGRASEHDVPAKMWPQTD